MGGKALTQIPPENHQTGGGEGRKDRTPEAGRHMFLQEIAIRFKTDLAMPVQSYT